MNIHAEDSRNSQDRHTKSSTLSIISREDEIKKFLNLIDIEKKETRDVIEKVIAPEEKRIRNVFNKSRDLLYSHYQKIEQVLKESLQMDLEYLQEEEKRIFETLKVKKEKFEKNHRKM